MFNRRRVQSGLKIHGDTFLATQGPQMVSIKALCCCRNLRHIDRPKETARMALILLLLLGIVPASAIPDLKEEFCLTETFEPSCHGDEVIVMLNATYGRMSLGRCVKTDFGYIGCQKNVLDIVDRRCSGRRTCAITVPETLMEDRKPCNEEFKSYLETRYTCVPVVTPDVRHCQGSELLTVRHPHGIVGNVVTEETGCGTDGSPWRIEAKSGQKINFTLYDFDWNTNPRLDNGDMCPLYATITEVATGQKVNVCGKRGRESHVYTSMTNSVEVSIIRQDYRPEDEAYFLLKFDMIGCSDPRLPSHSRLSRNGNEATIGCTYDDRTWDIVCDGDHWKGTIGNCSNGYGGALISGQTGLLSLPMDVAIVIIAGVAFVIGAIIFVIGLYIIRRRNFHTPRPPQRTVFFHEGEQPKSGDVTEEEWRLAYQLPGGPAHKQHGGVYMQTSETGSANENEYAYVWDSAAPSAQSPHQVFSQTPEGDKRMRTALSLTSQAGNTNAHDGQYERRLPSKSGLDPVYERGQQVNPIHPQYFELDHMASPK